MSPETRARQRLFVRVLLVQMAAIVVLIFSIWVSSYQGRVNVVDSQRRGCERGKLDRAANAQGWRIAQQARLADGQVEVARQYARIAAGLEARSRIDCAAVFPHPKLIEFGHL